MLKIRKRFVHHHSLNIHLVLSTSTWSIHSKRGMFILADFPLALFSRRMIEEVTHCLDLVMALDIAHQSYVSIVDSSERLLEIHTNCALQILNYTLCFMLHVFLLYSPKKHLKMNFPLFHWHCQDCLLEN